MAVGVRVGVAVGAGVRVGVAVGWGGPLAYSKAPMSQRLPP